MAKVADIFGKIWMDAKTGKITLHPVHTEEEKRTKKERKFAELPMVKLSRHYKKIDAEVRAQEAKAYAAGHDIYDFSGDNKFPAKFELDGHGKLKFVPTEKKRGAKKAEPQVA